MILLNQVRPSPTPPMPLTIPAETHGRVMFYGFETTEDWLAQYTEANRAAYHIPSKGRLFDLNYALWILQKRSGICKLKYAKVFSNNAPIPSGRIEHQQTVPFPKNNGTYIVSICSSKKISFLRRPNQAQVDLLKQIMDDKEPRWWVDYANRASYK